MMQRLQPSVGSFREIAFVGADSFHETTGYPTLQICVGVGLGHVPLGKLSAEMVRTWYREVGKELAMSAPKKLKDGSAPKASRTGETRRGQAYRLLHGVLATAKADGLIAENPARIPKAGRVSPTARPLMTLTDFVEITDHLPPHHRTALYVALGGHLRLGELVGLRVKDRDAKTATITVDGQVIRTSTGLQRTQPKTASSHRTVVVPSVTAEILARHLKGTPRALPNASLLARPDGRPITRSALQSSWKRARAAAKLEHFTLHPCSGPHPRCPVGCHAPRVDGARRSHHQPGGADLPAHRRGARRRRGGKHGRRSPRSHHDVIGRPDPSTDHPTTPPQAARRSANDGDARGRNR